MAYAGHGNITTPEPNVAELGFQFLRLRIVNIALDFVEFVPQAEISSLFVANSYELRNASQYD